MNIRNVTVCGSGVLGRQIAYHTAFRKFNVVVYDIKEELLEIAKRGFHELSEVYKQEVNATQQEVEDAIRRISYSGDLRESVKDADLVIEAIPENIQIKKEFYTRLGKVAPEKTIFCTNSSTCCQVHLHKRLEDQKDFLPCILQTTFGKGILLKSWDTQRLTGKYLT